MFLGHLYHFPWLPHSQLCFLLNLREQWMTRMLMLYASENRATLAKELESKKRVTMIIVLKDSSKVALS